MANKHLSAIFVMIVLISDTLPVQMPIDTLIINSPHDTISKFNNVNVCFKPDKPSKDYFSCFGQQMLRKLQDLEDTEEFNLSDGVSMKRDESGPRDISNFLDKDPTDIRSIIEGASTLMSRRSMQWDMGFIYPGLNMRVGPAFTGSGVLEFVLDPRIRDRDSELGREPTTARLIAKSFIVPLLLGFKFQLATLLPLIFGVLVLLSKKALILAKIAVFAASFFGLNSLAAGESDFPEIGLIGGGYGGGYGGGFGSGYGYGNRYHEPNYFLKQGELNPVHFQENSDPYYASNTFRQDRNTYKGGQDHSPEDLRDRLEKLFSTKHDKDLPRNGRNFAWNQE